MHIHNTLKNIFSYIFWNVTLLDNRYLKITLYHNYLKYFLRKYKEEIIIKKIEGSSPATGTHTHTHAHTDTNPEREREREKREREREWQKGTLLKRLYPNSLMVEHLKIRLRIPILSLRQR